MFNEDYFWSVSYASIRLSCFLKQLESKTVSEKLRTIFKLEYYQDEFGAVVYRVVKTRGRISYRYNTKEYDFESFCYLTFLELQKDIMPSLCSFYNNFSDSMFNYAKSQIAENNSKEYNIPKPLELM